VKRTQYIQRGERRKQATKTLQLFGRYIIATQKARVLKAQQVRTLFNLCDLNMFIIDWLLSSYGTGWNIASSKNLF
jgi:hypothetical protein